MDRAQSILTHGWLGPAALTVMTGGYYPFTGFVPPAPDAPIVHLTTEARSFALTSIRNFNLTYRRDQ